MYKLFEYQENNLSSVIDFFDHGGKSVILNLPTGTGKSLIASEFIKRYREQSKPVYFITHSSNLLWQFSKHLEEFGLMHGIIKTGCPVLGYRIQVISVQSLMNRIRQIDEPFAIIAEECHHFASNQFMRILEHWPNVKILGLTATPGRPDGKPLDMFEDIIKGQSLRWFIENYYLSDYDYFIPGDFNTEGIHKLAGEFKADELASRIKEDKSRIGNFVKHYELHAKGLPSIAFGTSINDSENIAKQFNDSGYDMVALHSKMDGDIQEYLNKAKSGILKMISTCEIVGEGTDIKGLECMLDGRPTMSIVLQVQHWGRPLRSLYAPGYDLSTIDGRREAMQEGGKGRAQILDFSSNYLRHGLPDDEREWSLKGATKLKTESKYKRCPNCQRPVIRVLMKCPYCEYEFPRMAEVSREPEEVEGSLIPIGSMRPEDKNGLILMIARQANDLRQAIAIAKRHGADHRAGWFVWVKILGKEEL